jgi:3-hydroxybutyryl-CoA dehydratase
MLTEPFERIQVGQKARSRARTITETDVVMFAALSADWYPLHTDAEYARQTPFGQRIAHGLLVLSVSSGLLDLRPSLVRAFYGLDRVRFTAPTFIGDTVHVESEVESKEDRGTQGGLVSYQIATKKADGETVLAAVMKILVAKASQLPS